MLRLPGFAWYEHVRRIRQRNFEKKLKKIRTKKYRSHKQRRLYKKSKPIRYERQKTNREFIKDRLFIDILRKEFRVSETNLPTKPNSTLRYIRTRIIKRVLKNLQKKNKFFFNFLLEDREISGARTETDTVLLRSYWDAARVEQIRTTINNNFFQRQSWRQVSEAAIPYFVSNKIQRIFGYTSSLGYQRIQRAHILDFDQQHKIQQYSLFPNLTNSPYSNYDLKTFFKQNWNKFLLYDFDKVSLHMDQVLSIANLSVYNDVWHKLASLSGKTASEHKYLFVLGAQTWLKTRLIEKFIATWCVNQKFSEKIKTDIIKNSRIMLFTKTPDWFIVQARQRLFILSQTVSLPNQNYIFLRKEYQKKITVSQIVDLLDSWKIKPYKQEKLFLNFHKFIFARIEGIAQYFGRTNETIFATQNQLNKILPINKPRFHYISYHDSTYESGVFAHVARLTSETYQKFTTQKFIAPTTYNKHEFTNALSDKKRLKERYAQYLTKQERTALDNKQNNIIQKKRFNSVPKNSLKNSSDLLSNIGAGTRLLLSKIIQHTNARQLNNPIYSSFLQKHMERASKKETIFEKEKWEDAEPRINVMLPLFEKQRQAEANDSEDYEEKYTLSSQIWTVEDFQAVFPVKINENTHTYRPISQHIFDLFFRENYKKSDLIFSNTDVLSKPSLMKKIPVYKEMENYRVDANLESHYKLDSNLIFDLEDKYSSFVAKTQNENYDLQTHSQAMIRAQYKNFKHFIKNKNKKYLNLKKPTLFFWHKIGSSKKRKILIAYARKKFLRIAKTFQKNKKVHLSPNSYSSQFLVKRIPARKARTAHYHLHLKSNRKRQISARRYLKRKLRIRKTTIKKLDNLKKKEIFR